MHRFVINLRSIGIPWLARRTRSSSLQKDQRRRNAMGAWRFIPNDLNIKSVWHKLVNLLDIAKYLSIRDVIFVLFLFSSKIDSVCHRLISNRCTVALLAIMLQQKINFKLILGTIRYIRIVQIHKKAQIVVIFEP